MLRLISRGRELEDGRKLSDYSLKDKKDVLTEFNPDSPPLNSAEDIPYHPDLGDESGIAENDWAPFIGLWGDSFRDIRIQQGSVGFEGCVYFPLEDIEVGLYSYSSFVLCMAVGCSTAAL